MAIINLGNIFPVNIFAADSPPPQPIPLVHLPIKRGVKEILPILEMITKLGATICGGYARYCLSPLENPAPANDVDIYLIGYANYQELIELLKLIGFKIAAETDFALSYERDEKLLPGAPPLQVIKPVWHPNLKTQGPPETIIASYDFTICQAAILNEKEGIASEAFVKDETEKKLRFVSAVTTPVTSVSRCMKYAARGYELDPSEVTKIFEAYEKKPAEVRKEILDKVKDKKNYGAQAIELGIPALKPTTWLNPVITASTWTGSSPIPWIIK